MTRVLIGIVVVLVCGLGIQQCRLDVVTEAKAQAEAELDEAVTVNGELNTTIAELKSETKRLAAMASEYAERRDQEAQRRADAQRKLEELASENEQLRAYLDSAIPGRVAGWMWLQAPGDNQDRDGKAEASSLLAEGNQSPGIAHRVTHERGWQWCWDVRAALSSCNADKAALRQWSAGPKEMGPP